VRDGLSDLPRLDGKRIAVVTGTAMTPIMPGILDSLAEQTGATFELIPAVNSLFGQTVTAAGLLVGADILDALRDLRGVDLALFPAETLNDDEKFLDNQTLASVRASLPMPVFPSYDFIDVLAHDPAAMELA
jgi:hypothetical protein